MDWDEVRPKTTKAASVGENLETLSVAELERAFKPSKPRSRGRAMNSQRKSSRERRGGPVQTSGRREAQEPAPPRCIMVDGP